MLYSIVSAFTLMITVVTAQFIPTLTSCDTAPNAVLTSCQALVNNVANWNAAFAASTTCDALPGIQARKICNVLCCVYAATTSLAGVDPAATRLEAQGLLAQCGNTATNAINGVTGFTTLLPPSVHAVCFSSPSTGSCTRCFDGINNFKRELPEKRVPSAKWFTRALDENVE